MAVDKITISGHELKVRHDISREKLDRLASWIDKLIKEKKEKFGNISLTRCALLVALDLADKLDERRSSFEKETTERAQRLIQEIEEAI